MAALLSRHRKGRGHVGQQQSWPRARQGRVEEDILATEEQSHKAHTGQGGGSGTRPQLQGRRPKAE